MALVQEIRDIPLKDLVIGKGQVRKHNVGKDIDELAESIRVNGLLEPIVVAPAEQDGKYEILTGQRRFLAHQKLQAETITAAVIPERVDEITAKVVSLTENLVRRDLDSRDLIDACTALYKKYGNMRIVAEETGLPYNKVRHYVKYDRLAESLKDMVDKGEVDLPTALKAQDAAEALGGAVDPDEAAALAKEMAPMSGPQRQKLVNDRRENPEKSVHEAIEDAKTGGKVIQVIATLGQATHKALQAYAKEGQVSQDEAASSLIADGLLHEGFLEEA